MTASTQSIRNTKIFALSRKVLFINRKDNRNCHKVGYFLRKLQIIRVNKKMRCKIFRILLKHVSNHLLVLFQFV